MFTTSFPGTRRSTRRSGGNDRGKVIRERQASSQERNKTSLHVARSEPRRRSRLSCISREHTRCVYSLRDIRTSANSPSIKARRSRRVHAGRFSAPCLALRHEVRKQRPGGRALKTAAVSFGPLEGAETSVYASTGDSPPAVSQPLLSTL